MSVPDQLQKLFPGISLRPALACEITPYGVLAARQDQAAGLGTQFAPIPATAIEPGWKSQNVLDRPSVVAALRTAISAVAEKGRKLAANRALTLIVPDATVRVLLLDFDAIPAKRAEALAILRFRLRKLVPFDVEDAAISWQTMSSGTEGVRLLVLVMPKPILVEYESLIREAGFIPGVVLPSTVAAAPLVGAEPTLVVNRNGETLTTAIVRGGDLLLHRTLNLGGGAEDTAPDAPPRPPLSAEQRVLQDEEDIRQTVSVALAYFEDTLAAPPAELFYIGPGTAEDFGTMLGEPGLAVRDLGAAPELPSRTVPRSLLAPVTGALLNV